MAYVAPSVVTAGDAVTAASYNVLTNDILQFAPFVQGVFTTEAARDAAITSPTEGMHAYLTASTVAAATGGTTHVPTGIQTIYNGTAWVCVTSVSAYTITESTTASTTYTPTLAAGGTNPSVTLSTGTTALISFSIQSYSQTLGKYQFASVAVSGATTLAASDDNATGHLSPVNGTSVWQYNANTIVLSGLTAGTNTFTLNYRTSTATNSNIGQRRITVQGIA